MNFAKDLTVFVISCGENPCYNECIKALQQQTLTFNIEIIKNVHPMSAAFQLMIDSCKTSYYIEIDEDMVMNENGIETLYNFAKQSNNKTAIIICNLIDVHLDFEISGVKIYKHDILKKYPYNLESMSCEVEQIDRLKQDGYLIKLFKNIVGKHAPQWSNEGIFERYYNLMDKFKQFKYIWIADLPLKLWNILKSNPSENNLYAFLGIYTSLINDNIQIGEKDFRCHHRSFERARSFLQMPINANLYLTSKCNFNCNFCYRNTNLIEQAPDLTIETVNNLLSKFDSLKSFCCAGYGEPFLNQNLFQIINHLKNKNKIVGLITNGSLIIDRANELLNAKPDYISISLNAPNAKLHNKINNSNTFQKVLQGIDFCISNDLNTFCSYVCTKSNLKYVPEFLKLVKDHGVKTVHLLNLLPHLAVNYDDENFWNEVLTYNDKKEIDELQNLPEADIIKLYPTLIQRNEIRCNCQIPWTTIGINGNGSVSFCGSVFAPAKEHGTIKDNIVWQNDYASNLRDSLCEPNKMNDTCKLCFRNWNEYVPTKKNVQNIQQKPTLQNKKLTICKIIDQFGWAYYFIAKDQQKYSTHNIEYKRLLDVTTLSADVVYIHSPNIDYTRCQQLITQLKQKNVKIIGGYGGECKMKYEPEPDIIVSISIQHLDFLRQMYPNKSVIFLPEAIDTNYFIPSNKKSNSFIVGWAGCIRDVKRPYLLDQLDFKVEKKSDWGKQYFVDGQTLDKMKDFYNSIDVLILTSISECMPRVVLEAMACGLPVVSTKVGSICMLLDEQWIVSVTPDDQVIKEMNEKLLLLKNNLQLRRQTGERNRQHIEKFFSWSVTQKLWDNTFQLVMQNKFKEIENMSNDFINLLPNRKNIDFKNLDIQFEQTTFKEIEQIQPIVESKQVTRQLEQPTSNLVFVSYYTKNTGYEKEYKTLELSLKKFKLNYEIIGINSQGSWFANCFYRTEFVKDMLNKHRCPVVWVDCDAIIQQQPELLFKLDKYDFAYHLRMKRNNTSELLGGTMYFNYTQKAFELLEKWKQLVNSNNKKYKLDQSYLHEAVNSLQNLKTYILSPAYCQIFDTMKDADKPVIEHFQASRRLKNE